MLKTSSLLSSISKSLLIKILGIFFNTLQSRNVIVKSAATKSNSLRN